MPSLVQTEGVIDSVQILDFLPPQPVREPPPDLGNVGNICLSDAPSKDLSCGTLIPTLHNASSGHHCLWTSLGYVVEGM